MQARAAEAQIHSLLILSLDGGKWSASHPGCFICGQTALISTKQEAQWAMKPTQTFLKRGKHVATARTRTPDRPACGQVTITTTLSQLHCKTL